MLQEQTVSPYLLASLKKLMPLPELAEFRLVGGTALALCLGHRNSVDIDLFTDNKSVGMFGVKSKLENMQNIKILTESMDLIKGLYWGFCFSDENKVQHDIRIQKARFVDAPHVVNGIRMASLKDIAIAKLNAITERVAKKDFIDLYYLHGEVDLVKIFNTDFFKVFPLQKTKPVLSSLASVVEAMNSKSEMPTMLEPSFKIEQVNATLLHVVDACCEVRGLRKPKPKSDR